MDVNQITELASNLTIYAGAFASGTAIIVKLVNMFTTLKKIASTKANTDAIISQTDKVVTAVKDSLVADVEVDITSQIQPIITEVRDQYNVCTQNVANQMYAMKTLLVQLCTVMAESRKLSKDEQDKFKGIIDVCNNVINNSVPEKKNKILVKCKEVKEAVSTIIDSVKENSGALTDSAKNIINDVKEISNNLTVV